MDIRDGVSFFFNQYQRWCIVVVLIGNSGYWLHCSFYDKYNNNYITADNY